MALSKIKSDSVDSIAATKLTGTVDNARITLDAAEIPNLDAAKITTGSIANARIPAADLTPAHQGIANLGLIMATEHDKVAFNLTGSFIDIFQDSSGIATTTDTSRNASEYVSSVTSVVTSGEWSTDANTMLLLHMNDTGLTDSSPNTHAVTLVGNATRSSTQSKFGSYSLYCDGTGDWLRVTDHADFTFGTGDFTMETWVYPVSAGYGCFMSGGNWGGPNYSFLFDHTGSNTLRWHLYNGSAAPATSSGTTISLNTWTHLAACRSGSTTTVYINGVADTTLSGSESIQSNGDLFIGNMANLNEDFYGYLDEMRISNTARYTGNFTVESAGTTLTTNATGTLISNAQTVASTSEVSGVFTYTDSAGTNTIGTDLKIYFTANNGTNWTEADSYGTATTFSGSIKQVKLGKTTVTAGTQVALKAEWANQVEAVAGTSGLLDKSGTSKTVTNNGVTQSSAITPKWGAKALYFNGSSNLSITAHTDFDFASADATIEFWYYSTTNSSDRIISRGSHPGEWFYRSRFADDAEDFKSYINGSNQSSTDTGRHGALNTWTHGAIVRDGSNIRVYTGGVQRWSTAVSGSWTVTSTANAIGIGRGIDAGTGEWFTGYLQDIRISNTARYPSGTTFAVPAAAFTADGNTKLLISGNDTAEVTGKVAHLNGWAVNY